MRKFFILTAVLFCLILPLGLYGCEQSTQIEAATITENTAAGSSRHVIRVTYKEDKRLEEKNTDIQVMSNVEMDDVKITPEGGETFVVTFDDAGQWLSLETLFVESQGKHGYERYELFGEALAKSYIIESPKPATLLFRVVVGDAVENENGLGQVMTMSQTASNVYKLKVKASKE